MKNILLTSFMLLFAAIGVACSCQENASPPAAQSQTQEPKERSMTSSEPEGFCDKSPGNGFAHSSFANMKDFVREIEKHPRALSPAQCLAVSAYAKTFDWFGEACDERSAEEAAVWLKGCYQDDWKAGLDSTRLDCQLLGRHDDGMYQSVSILKEYLVNNFSDCEWGNRRLHQLLTPELIREATLLLSDPAE